MFSAVAKELLLQVFLNIACDYFYSKMLGSEVEDRQYQLDVIGMEMNTGIWEELDPILSRGTPLAATLKTMNENPALEWNNLEKSRLSLSENLDLLPMISKLVLFKSIFFTCFLLFFFNLDLT